MIRLHRLSFVWVALLTAANFLSANVPAATLPYYDALDTYTQNERLGGTTSGVNWTVGNSTGTGSAEIRSEAALTYSALSPPGDPSGKGIFSTGLPASGRDRGVSFTIETLDANNPTIFSSFLMNVQAAPSGNDRLLAGFRSDNGGGGFTPRIGLFLKPTLELALSKNSLTAAAGTTSALNLNTTYLVVMGYQWVSGTDDDVVSVWVNPTPLGGAAPAPNLSVSTGIDAVANANFGGFHFTLRSVAAQNGGGTYYFDEPRIGKTYADVTPVPEPSSLLLMGITAMATRSRRRRC